MKIRELREGQIWEIYNVALDTYDRFEIVELDLYKDTIYFKKVEIRYNGQLAEEIFVYSKIMPTVLEYKIENLNYLNCVLIKNSPFKPKPNKKIMVRE